METSVICCDICGKTCKNERGLSIHKGHMHKEDTNGLLKIDSPQNLIDINIVTKEDIVAELHSLRQLIINLGQLLRQMKYDNHVKWEPLSESFPMELSSSMDGPTVGSSLGMNYGYNHSDLMDELRSVLKERVLVSA
ncbi:MAG: hypothetical protein ACFFA5_10035 [Promethearchaeota archaeon]